LRQDTIAAGILLGLDALQPLLAQEAPNRVGALIDRRGAV
jgi:hypothetical protein